MIDPKLLEILCCPETKEDVSLADPALIGKINEAIVQGVVKNRRGLSVTERIDGGLVRKDGKYLYPIREDIPIMLIDEALPLESIS
jgi:uncharacterized protein YbaR (Trm112 family)